MKKVAETKKTEAMKKKGGLTRPGGSKLPFQSLKQAPQSASSSCLTSAALSSNAGSSSSKPTTSQKVGPFKSWQPSDRSEEARSLLEIVRGVAKKFQLLKAGRAPLTLVRMNRDALPEIGSKPFRGGRRFAHYKAAIAKLMHWKQPATTIAALSKFQPPSLFPATVSPKKSARCGSFSADTLPLKIATGMLPLAVLFFPPEVVREPFGLEVVEKETHSAVACYLRKVLPASVRTSRSTKPCKMLERQRDRVAFVEWRADIAERADAQGGAWFRIVGQGVYFLPPAGSSEGSDGGAEQFFICMNPRAELGPSLDQKNTGAASSSSSVERGKKQ
ncbi:unnamed protein product [Amoebophrya sp. A25]|nr:unnamed protein product [Amoebophrya sp. A25]|eukprot:GSA25T00020192001.1